MSHPPPTAKRNPFSVLRPLALIFASAFLVLGTALPAQDQDKEKEPPDDGAPEGPVPPYKEALKIDPKSDDAAAIRREIEALRKRGS